LIEGESEEGEVDGFERVFSFVFSFDSFNEYGRDDLQRRERRRRDVVVVEGRRRVNRRVKG